MLIECAGYYCWGFFYTYSAPSHSSMFFLLIFFEVDHLCSLIFRFHFLSQLSGHRSYSCLMTWWLPQYILNWTPFSFSLPCSVISLLLLPALPSSYYFPTVSHDANFHVVSWNQNFVFKDLFSSTSAYYIKVLISVLTVQTGSAQLCVPIRHIPCWDCINNSPSRLHILASCRTRGCRNASHWRTVA